MADAPEVDWFYPDIHMFGACASHDYGGDYRRLTACLVNISEAGSLVRRRVFESGLRYDETMRMGYEDWDFWLSALERGFSGRHLPALGLAYRKRAESMLAESHRRDSDIREYLTRKHAALYDLRALNALEHAEAPRWALVSGDVVQFFTDPALPATVMTRAEWLTAFWQAMREPAYGFAGAFVLFAPQDLLPRLTAGRLSRWFFQACEGLLVASDAVRIVYVATGDDAFVENVPEEAGGIDEESDFGAVAFSFSFASLRAAADGADAAISVWRELKVATLKLGFPQAPEPVQNHALTAFSAFIDDFRHHELSKTPAPMHADRRFGAPPLVSLHEYGRARFGGGLLPLATGSRAGKIAFVTPIVDFGGVEKVAFCFAAALKEYGFSSDLVVVGPRRVKRFAEACAIFDHIFFIDASKMHSWSGDLFMGTPLSPIGPEARRQDLENLLASYEIVISAHSSEALDIFSALRKRGVVTASHLHVFDRTSTGRSVGHPVLALAYEHALDFVLTCSRTLGDEVAGLGVPRSKIVTAPNAASLRPSAQAMARLRARRAARSGGPLNVLFLGRLDRQKGLDRLRAIQAALAGRADMRLRMVGKAVMDAPDPALAALVEPPVYDAASLAALYEWADALILPSRYEGLPLTLLEAMAFGVAPIAADCGAVNEAIRDGVDGFLVSQDEASAQTIARLDTFARAPELLWRVQEAALAASERRSWSTACENFLAALDARGKNL
ncbi:glycosyltransferase [Methylocystis parvus]|uniref:glycosyltransferase n=1 Tax=Methylocystis parvus TaxID=134 RepID=UPI001FD5C222|nr:glycosyltransferase family 4 protein [Methylocystis parvus]WBK00825.1 glycosyltransferase family 4 protein [Methylocystis parvus OBBP]